MLPDLDGFEVIRRLREGGVRTPVVFLTARDATDDKIRGLTLGGDDYVTKPFSLEELTARIRAVLRRSALDQPEIGRRCRFADLELDEESHEVRRARQAGLAVAHRVQAAAVPAAQRRPGAVEGPDPRPRLAVRLPGRRQHRGVVHLLPSAQGRHDRAAADPHPARRRVRPAPAVVTGSPAEPGRPDPVVLPPESTGDSGGSVHGDIVESTSEGAKPAPASPTEPRAGWLTRTPLRVKLVAVDARPGRRSR